MAAGMVIPAATVAVVGTPDVHPARGSRQRDARDPLVTLFHDEDHNRRSIAAFRHACRSSELVASMPPSDCYSSGEWPAYDAMSLASGAIRPTIWLIISSGTLAAPSAATRCPATRSKCS